MLAENEDQLNKAKNNYGFSLPTFILPAYALYPKYK